MSTLPLLYLVRHGQTPWSLLGKHTGRTDLALTPEGEEEARRVGARLRDKRFERVFTSPLQRAANTCELAGYGPSRTIDGDLVEWDYGAYEGRRTNEIRAERPDWDVFRDGCPGGEAPETVLQRVERVLARARAIEGDVLLFSSAHVLRVLAMRWLRRPVDIARNLVLAPASLSVLGYEHSLDEPVIITWNDTSHLRSGP